MAFDKLPFEINRLIGSYLDYNSRVELSRALPVKHDKFVRKLDSESHDYKVRTLALTKMIKNTMRPHLTLSERAVHMAKIFKSFTDTPTCVLLRNSRIYGMVLQRATKFANKDDEQYENIEEEPKQYLIQEANRLLQKCESCVPTGIPKTVRSKLITIV
jgi:hypothetical protein